ncbi:MAG: enoyl-CoA hydratase/isomerase family protein [Myxococcales bacterium]|nr:enoyl-CoA hydratase/isomerase family protein [Myxococcales bacterium]
MSSDHVSLERHGAIAVVQLNRPPANALELEFALEFEAAFDSILRDAPEAMVLTGSGRFFSGGLDLKVVPAYAGSDQQVFLRILNRMIGKLYACPIPVVGAINGHAIAGGLILALTTDYRIGPATDSLFGLTEARVGIPFPAATMAVLQAELAAPDVRYATLTARLFGPEEARARGILDELQPTAALLERAIEVARDLASMPADGYRRIKHQVRGAAITRIEQLTATDSDPMLQGWLSPEAREAAAAILTGSRGG